MNPKRNDYGADGGTLGNPNYTTEDPKSFHIHMKTDKIRQKQASKTSALAGPLPGPKTST